MGGRRDDSDPGRSAPPPARAGSAVARPPARPATGGAPSGRGRWWLVVGMVLAAAATAAVFFTDDPLYLRVALLAVCWAFVVAAFLAGNRRADQVAAAAREAELRHAYDLEIEREVTARHEYEVELEGRLRREAEDVMRAGLTALREDLAAVSQLRADLAGLGQLRTELAALSEIRGELAGLGQLRAELTGLGELRTDLGRMRTELTEQLSGELLIERMVMRAQSVRGLSQPGPAQGRTLDGATAWDVDRWAETRVVPAEPAEPMPRPIAGPPPVPPPVSLRSPLARPVASAPEPAAPHRHRRAAPDDDEVGTPAPAAPAWTPARDEPPAWTALSFETPSWEAPAPVADAPVPHPSSYDGSAYDAMLFGTAVPAPDPAPGVPGYEAPSWSTGSTAWSAGTPTYDSSGYGGSVDDPAPRREPEPSGHARLEQILAENGVDAPPGGRSRRRRYRDEDAGDDVLARVLGQ